MIRSKLKGQWVFLWIFLWIFSGSGLALAQQQIISPESNITNVAPGGNFTLSVDYDVSDDNKLLDSFTVYITYNSDILECLGWGNIAVTPTAKTEDVNGDGDLEEGNEAEVVNGSSKKITITWLNNFPGGTQTLPLQPLFEVNFRVKSTAEVGAKADISFTGIADESHGYSFVSNPDKVEITVVAPGISVAPSPHDFGAVPVGDSKTQSFTITNSGNDALTIGSITLEGTYAAEFSIQNDNCSNQTVAQGGNCTLDVVFNPQTVGAKVADISIPSNAPGSPTIVPLNGIGAGFGTTDNSVSISGVPYAVACNGTINGGVPITVSEGNLGLTISVNSTEISEGYDQIHQIGAVIVDDSAQIGWTAPDKNENDLAGQNIRYLKAILNQVKVKKESGEVSVTVPVGALVYYKARTAGGTWISGSVENLQQNGPVTTQGNTVTFDPGNLIQKVRDALQNRTTFDFCDVPGEDVALSGTYKFWVLTNAPLACYENGNPAPFTSTGSLSNVYGQVLQNATMLYGKVNLTADAIQNLFCPPTPGPGPGPGPGPTPTPTPEVETGGTVAPDTTGSVSTGSTVSDVTNEGTIENSGTIQDSTNKGTIEGGNVAGTIENTEGTLKDVSVAENAVVKGGNVEGTVTVGDGAKLENVKVAADATLNLSGTGIEVTVVSESGSSIVLQPGSTMHGVVSSPEGASLNIPEGAIVTITGTSVVIQFSRPEIPGSGFSSFAALSIPALPEGYTLVDALTVCPDGYRLSQPATLVIPYDATKIPADLTKADLMVFALDPDTVQWVEVAVKEATDNNVTIDTDMLSTYAVVAQSVIYPVITTAVGTVVDPESVSTPIGSALVDILPGIGINVEPDSVSGLLDVNIAGTSYPVVATATGTAQVPEKARLEVLNGGLSAQFVLTDGTTIQIAPMVADPEGLNATFANAGLTTEFMPDNGMIIVKDASNNSYAGIFGWGAGASGTKTIDKVVSADGRLQVAYMDGTTQDLAPMAGDIQKLRDWLLNAGITECTIDRNTGIINVNGSSWRADDYLIGPFHGFPDLIWFNGNKNSYGLAFEVDDYNGDGLQDVKMWSTLGKQKIYQLP